MRRTGPLTRLALAALLALGAGVPAPATATGPLAHRDDLSERDRARVARVLAPPADAAAPEPFEAMPGGATSARVPRGEAAFRQPAANLAPEALERFALGNGLFRKLWVAAPSSTQASDGLGPLYNARACRSCHLNDGRGHGAGGDGFVLRLGRAGPDGAVGPDPRLGRQLQDRAAPGLAAEGRVETVFTDWTPPAVAAAAAARSEPVPVLRRPAYSLAAPDGSAPVPAPEPRLLVSPRVAQPMIGLGLLAAIDAGDILANADPDDRDGDGVSGRPSLVEDPETGARILGRFGWKAAAPTLTAQTAQALSTDMGLSTRLHPAPAGDCTAAQPDCLARPDGVQPRLGPVEVPDDVLAILAFYAGALAPPVRPTAGDPAVLAGKALFTAAGCAVCHVPKFVTRRDAADPHAAFQLVWPYSDLLLHDMGEDLADGFAEGFASGREWRTPPLWGLGATAAVSGRAEFLHDGRARTPWEAVLWHGGEAAGARAAALALDPGERDALLAFLNSL